MGTQSDSMTRGSSPTKEAGQLEEIAETRAQMGRTIEELHGKLNPTVLKEQALEQFHEAKESIKAEVKTELEDAKIRFKQELTAAKAAVHDATFGKVEHMISSARETVKETGTSIIDTIKENPIPIALAAVGIGWLFLNMRSSSKRSRIGVSPAQQTTLPLGEHEKGTLGKAVQQVSDTATSAAHAVEDKVGELGRDAGELARGAQMTVSRFAHDGLEQGRLLESRVEQTYRDNPLAVGLVVVALGIGIGLAIPITKKEDQWMGQARDVLAKKVEQAAHGALQEVEKVATDGIDRTADRLKLDGSSATT